MPIYHTSASEIPKVFSFAVSAAMVAGLSAAGSVQSTGPVVIRSGPDQGTGSTHEKWDARLSEEVQIAELSAADAEEFELLKPIPVRFKSVSGNLVAYVPEADLAFSGVNRQDAMDHLMDWMLGLFDDLIDEDQAALGPRPAHQLEILKEHLRRRV